MVAQKLGLPVKHFIAANNANNVVTKFLETSQYQPMPSIQTISNAMDVGNPSNFVRIKYLYNNDFQRLKTNLSSFSFSDAETSAAIVEIFNKCGYVADPHGAIGYLGCKNYLKSHKNTHCVFLETAHPTKFLDVVQELIPEEIKLPPQIKAVINKEKTVIFTPNYEKLKKILKDF